MACFFGEDGDVEGGRRGREMAYGGIDGGDEKGGRRMRVGAGVGVVQGEWEAFWEERKGKEEEEERCLHEKQQ